MTTQELTQSLNLMLTNYSKDYDNNLYALWAGLFINLDATDFRAACFKIITTSKFFPTVSEIITSYKSVGREAKYKHFERLDAEYLTHRLKENTAHEANIP